MRTRVKEVVHHLTTSSSKDETGETRHRSLSFLHRDHPDDADDLDKAFRKRESISGDPSLRLETTNRDPKAAAGSGGTLHPSGDRGDLAHNPGPSAEKKNGGVTSIANPGLLFEKLEKRDTLRHDGKGPTTLAQCDTPLELAGEKETVLVDTQIQLYATNAQLCHPWVSPVLGYLGGLPPLFICAGDNEVLRDEITYL
jgi:acetyl esterase/lipase